jgi:putative SOS response-associated peptidase YedK
VIRVFLLAILAICSRYVLCGRFNLTNPADVVARFGFMDWSLKRPEPRFNIAPSQEILTIVQLPNGPAFVQTAVWGLKPFWLKSSRPPPINARAESLTSSPMFRDALTTGRCLIPASGFYEWRALGSKQRQPMHIQLVDKGVFAFAGLWLPPARHGGLPTAAIITTRPNELMATIHTRMPAILRPEDEATWLDSALTRPDDILSLLGPFPAEQMQAYPVAALVNSWENEGPELVQASASAELRVTEVQASLPFGGE